MKLETLRKLYIAQLRDIYDSENQLLVAIPKMAAAASHQELKMAFNQHLAETKEQVNRLERIFDALGESPKGEACEATQGLVKEAKEVIAASGDDDVIDAGLIGAAQKVEHYEIANYGTVVTYAQLLGEQQASQLLQQTLDEEKRTDKRLTMLATRMINRDASHVYASSPSEDSSNGSSSVSLSLLSLLLGAAAGVAAGMLLAPSTGTETRNMLADKANAWKDQLEDKYDNLTGSKADKYTSNESIVSEETNFGAPSTSYSSESTSFGEEDTDFNRGSRFDANDPNTYGRESGV